MKNTKESVVPVDIGPFADDNPSDCVKLNLGWLVLVCGRWLSVSVDTSKWNEETVNHNMHIVCNEWYNNNMSPLSQFLSISECFLNNPYASQL